MSITMIVEGIALLLLGVLLVLGVYNRIRIRNKGILNGHQWVDLGLPSGTLWATCNVGADSPKECGNYSDTKTIEVNGVSFTMVKVEGGTFMMGATPEQGEDAFDNERPVHQVSLDDYYIGQTQVTQALWQAVMGMNPSKFKGKNNPVECVSWYVCREFVKKLSEKTGCRFRLPTEAQWEYAARGGNKSKGYKYAGSNDLDAVAWYDGNSSGQTHPVAQKAPNELGLYDMSGNVYEMCADWIGRYSEQRQHNPTGPASESFQVLRGGSWFNYARLCRVSFRHIYFPDSRYNLIGLRLVLVPGYHQILDGHEYVDLGLPSGTLWATCNVGADSPEECGDHFAWGETDPKSLYDWSTYKYGTSSSTLTKYCSKSSYGLNGYTDTKTVLDPEDDAATANWGSGWRMPTFDEINELYTECTISVWTKKGGMNGRLFTGPNGNTLFLTTLDPPAASSFDNTGRHAHYWSSSLTAGDPDLACGLYFDSGRVKWSSNTRVSGGSVRPVVKR